MKIGISSSSIESCLNNGILDGIGHYTEQLITKLPAYGIQTRGFAFPRLCQKINFSHSTALSHSFPVQLVLSSLTGGKPLNIGHDINLFHSTDYRVIPMNCPVVATIWDAIPFAHPEWVFSSKLKQILVCRILKKSARYADKVIAVSEHAARDLQLYFGVNENKIIKIPWCIKDAWLATHSADEIKNIQNKYNISGEYLLTVGTIQPRKNIARVVDAFLSLPQAIKKDLKLVIVGKYGWGSEDVLNKLKALAPLGQVVWLSSVDSDNELRALYQGAKLFVFPSLYEGFGMPVLEAFASKVPLITSNTTSIPEVCGDAAIQVNPLSTQEIKIAMISLLSDDNARKGLIKAGTERLNMFKEQAMLEKIISLYKIMV